nr:MAG TPA: hypothetical protein [Inoviridae sp.]
MKGVHYDYIIFWYTGCRKVSASGITSLSLDAV